MATPLELAQIRTFPQLVKYLRDELDWPITTDDFEELTYNYTPEELGIDAKNAARIEQIKRLKPLDVKQPWGVFFVKFERKSLPVVALRRILGSVVVKKRASANKSEQAAWNAEDLLFISNYGQGEARQISFAHFSENPEKNDLPTLKVLGWDQLDTALHIEDVVETLKERLTWPDDPSAKDAWRETWRSAFTLGHKEVITTSKTLAIRLAQLARAIRDRLQGVIEVENDNGPVTKLMKAFQEALIHDLDIEDFADMYAQTIAYGLLSARVTNPDADTADGFASQLPVTNPFLKELMETFLNVGGRRKDASIDFDELGINEVVELLDHAKMEAVIRDFGDRNPQEDPVIHFYELFLKEYDAKKRMQRGVFYTPRPVVSYIVRSVHQVLQSEFGLDDGLADTATWGAMAKKHKDLKIPDRVKSTDPFLTLLDPATGTGTFLVEVIDVIHRTMVERWKKEGRNGKKILDAWNDYVPEHLLPRLHGYELLMAPYAIAHMKIGLKLHETGYRFDNDVRARVFLTNSLEPNYETTGRLEHILPALAREAAAVNKIKEASSFTIVVGNPPYSYMSANLSPDARQLVAPFRLVDGKPVIERGALVLERALQDDYVKFWALALRLVEEAGAGIVSMISNSAYLASPQHRGMRSSFKGRLNRFRSLDLHGDLKREDATDENVFDIKTGVAIGFAERLPEKTPFKCAYLSLSGSRREKEVALTTTSLIGTPTEFFEPEPEQYSFHPPIEDIEYATWMSVADIFPLTSVGIKTNRDHLVIGFNDQEIEGRLQVLRDTHRSVEKVKDELGIDDNVQWSVAEGRKKFRATYSEENFRTLDYRPFDQRRIYYHPSIVFNPRPAVMSQFVTAGNLALLTNRKIRTSEHSHFFVTNKICMAEFLSSADNCNVYPLQLVGKGLLSHELDRPNLSSEFLKALSIAINTADQDAHGLPRGFKAEDIFNYMYAVFFSPEYRKRYQALLRVDYPRVPLPRGVELFRSLIKLGKRLVDLHLMTPPILDQHTTTVLGEGEFQVKKVTFADKTVWINKSRTQGFQGVPDDVWNFNIGSYQVCEKWLKDRGPRRGNPGRILSHDDIDHYQRIVGAISGTMTVMSEIDNTIDEYGGWPGAFRP